jgi:hypothetical protein
MTARTQRSEAVDFESMKKAGKYIEPCAEFKSRFGQHTSGTKSSIKMNDSDLDVQELPTEPEHYEPSRKQAQTPVIPSLPISRGEILPKHSSKLEAEFSAFNNRLHPPSATNIGVRGFNSKYVRTGQGGNVIANSGRQMSRTSSGVRTWTKNGAPKRRHILEQYTIPPSNSSKTPLKSLSPTNNIVQKAQPNKKVKNWSITEKRLDIT